MDTKEVKEIKNYRNNDLQIHLFVKKADGEGTDFYYLGKLNPTEFTLTTISDNMGNPLPIVNIRYRMQTSVRNDIYDYLTK